MATKKTRKKRAGAWLDMLNDAVGKFMHIETFDGVHREGKLSGLRTREIEVNGEIWDIPTAIEFNDEQSDYIEINLVQRFDID